ncbi:MAG: FAD-dependent oxidoreductase, partial [Acutalibacteraceae bacterium]
MKIELNGKDLPVHDGYDVIVAGGGPSGIAAAAAAAREGAKTLLIEQSGQLGGMATSGLVPAWTPYTDGIRIIYGGISKRIFLETKAAMPHIPKDKLDWVAIDFEALKENYANLLNETGVDIIYHTIVCDVVMKNERTVESIVVANKSGISAYKAPVFVDCTGDADIYAFSGGEYDVGDDGDVQPATMCFIMTNIDEDILYSMPYMHAGNKDSMIYNIVNDGKYNIPDTHFCHSKIAPKTFGFNAGHVWNIHSTDPEEVSKGITEGRALVHRLVAALKEYHPAFKDAYLVQTAPTLGIRESRRIKGDYTFTVDDYLARRSFKDEICRNNYFIDIHGSQAEKDQGCMDHRFEHYKDGESHGVPYRCLCPAHLDNVLVAGRTVSSDRITQGSLRIMPCCLCEGEAAGIAASMASRMKTPDIHNVNTDKLRDILKSHDAYLPDVE